MLAGAYFSKPDWHNENYWWPYFPPKDRNVNYDPKRYPDKWNAFKDFTYRQIKELMSEYGRMDILWLDGGWVRPLSSVDTSIEWQRGIKDDQDIDMKKIADMARSYQPGLIIVDRSVTGEFENYTTPEQEVPRQPLPYPWETCMTMAGSWSYVPNDHYKSTHQLIELLVRIVAKGGNLLLNIGPSPEGDWDTAAYQRLKEIGQWMKVNHEAIYETKPVPPYANGNICYTQSKDERTIYAISIADKDIVDLSSQLVLRGIHTEESSKVTMLGADQELKWKSIAEGTAIIIPENLKKYYSRHAVVFRIRKAAAKTSGAK
jgi:alpha-L-fucosidase